MLKSLRNPDGSVNRGAIYDLPIGDLKSWINQRLSGEDPYLPLGRSEELPHTLLLELFAKADPTHPFRKRLEQATRELLEPILTGRMAFPSPVWLGEALRLAFAVRAQVPRDSLRRAFESGRFATSPYLEADVDIELLDLLASQEGLEPIGFWLTLLEQPRYSLSAFAALERYGPQAVIQGLPLITTTLNSTPELGKPEPRLALPLKHVVERFGIDQLLPLIETELSDPVRVVVEGALRLVGIPMASTDMSERKSFEAATLREPEVPLLTPDALYRGASEAMRSYANRMQGESPFLDARRRRSRIRMLDLTTTTGRSWCAILFAEHEAEVIIVEPPGGRSLGRKQEMFKDNVTAEPSEDKFLHEARTEFSITLNLEAAEGRELLKKLAADADILVEDYPAGRFDAWGIGYRQLSQINPRLVYAWIGPVGHRGSRGDRPWQISDYVIGTYLAMQIMSALIYRDQVSGRGQFVEATGAVGIMRIIDYESPPSWLTQKDPSRFKWIGRPTGFDNEDVYRRMIGVKGDDLETLKRRGII